MYYFQNGFDNPFFISCVVISDLVAPHDPNASANKILGVLQRLFRMREPVYDELVRELFATFRFEAAEARGDVGRTRIYFRLGGEWRSCSVMEFVWRLGLYKQYETTQADFMLRLQNGETAKNDLECTQFWPNIGEGDACGIAQRTLFYLSRDLERLAIPTRQCT